MTGGITEIGELAKVLNYYLNYFNANTPDEAALQKIVVQSQIYWKLFCFFLIYFKTFATALVSSSCKGINKSCLHIFIFDYIVLNWLRGSLLYMYFLCKADKSLISQQV